jgi:hypothetical protein
MSETQIDIDAARDAADEVQDGNLRENEAGIPADLQFDYEQYDAPVVRGHPTALVVFDHIASVSPFNTDDGFLDAKQNLENGGSMGYGNDVMVTVKNPTIVEGQLWNEENDFRDYRLVGDVDSDESPYEKRQDVQLDDEGNVESHEINGVDLGMGKFDGEPADIDDFDTEYVQFLISSSRASDILGQLDTAGMWAYTSDGEFTEGIIEAPPKLGDDDWDTSEDGAPRAIGYPELRTDMVAQQGAIMWDFGGDGEATTQSPVEIQTFKVTDDGLQAIAPLTPDDDAYALPTYPRAGNVYWDHEGDTDAGSDAEPSSEAGMDDAAAAMQGESEESDGYDVLTDDGQNFVDNAVTAMQDAGVSELSDLGDKSVEERVATAKADGTIEATASELAAITNERV